MSVHDVFPIAAWLAILGVFYAYRRSRLERSLARQRAVYDASTRPEELAPRLDELVDVAVAALGRDIVRRPEVEEPDLGEGDDQDRLTAAVALCANRYGLDPTSILASFAPLPRGVAADVRGERDLRVRPTEASGLALESSPLPTRWRLRVSYRARKSDERLLRSVAHELAHAALGSRGVRYDDEHTTELITEVTAVLAGFGPIMLWQAYQEHRDYVFAVRMIATVRRQGYLHERSIEYLRRRRAELAGGATAA